MMSRESGSNMTKIMHIKQSIEDICSTPLGSRVMRRNYGTKLANFIDQPTSEALFLKCCSTIYSGILMWEPRIHVTKISIGSISSGQMSIDIEAEMVESGQSLNLHIPVSFGAML